MPVNIGSSEIVQVADVVAREKGVSKELVMEAIETALVKPAARQYGQDKDIKVVLNRRSGDIKTYRLLTVVEDDQVIEPENAEKQIKPSDAASYYGVNPATKKPYEPGDVISEELPPIDLRRVTAQIAKQVIVQKIKEAERDREYNDFIERVGEIAHGTVKRVEFGNVIVDLGSCEAVLSREHVIRGETFNPGDRVRALVAKVRRDNVLPQVLLSRTAPVFMAKLFSLEVPEIYERIIEIKAVARDPGSRAKMAIYSTDPNIDPVGSCVGVRGSRVQAVSNELLGEKVDIIRWSADPATFLVSAISPANVTKVIINERAGSMDVVVPEDELSVAIGRRGQNVRLASELIGWRINVMTEAAESDKRSAELGALISSFKEALDVDDIIAHLLATEGFASLEEVAYVEREELTTIEGFDESVADELQRRARTYLERKEQEAQSAIQESGLTEELLTLLDGALSNEALLKLSANNVKSPDDFADLSRDEFLDFVGPGVMKHAQIDELILRARTAAGWFGEESQA